MYKRGYLSLTRNYVLFHAESAATDEADRRYNVAVPLKDVVGIEVVPPRRIFASECVKVTTKEKEVGWCNKRKAVVHFMHELALRLVISTCLV